MVTTSVPLPTSTTSAHDLLGLVLAHGELRPDSPALQDDHGRFTYGELARHVANLASGLSALGVGAGDRVGLYLPNSADFVSLALSCLWLGAVWVPLQVNSPPPRLATVTEDCGPALVVAREEDGPALAGLGRRLATPAEVAAAGPAGVPRAQGTDRDAYLIYTSGTTGVPKGVRARQDAVCWETCRTAEVLGLDQTTRGLAVSAFNFDGSYGLVFPVLVAGGLLIVPRREDILYPKRFYQFVVDEEVTFTSFSPSHLRLALRARVGRARPGHAPSPRCRRTRPRSPGRAGQRTTAQEDLPRGRPYRRNSSSGARRYFYPDQRRRRSPKDRRADRPTGDCRPHLDRSADRPWYR